MGRGGEFTGRGGEFTGRGGQFKGRGADGGPHGVGTPYPHLPLEGWINLFSCGVHFGVKVSGEFTYGRCKPTTLSR